MNQKVKIVMYHYVRDIRRSRYSSIKGLEAFAFRQQLDYLTSNYHVVSTDEMLSALDGKTELHPNSVILTFDDGYLDHYTNVFPLLIDYGITGFFSMPGKIIAEGKLLDVNKIHFILASATESKIKESLDKLLDHYRGTEYVLPSNQELYALHAKENRFDTANVIYIKRLLQTELPEKLRNEITNRLFNDFVGVDEFIFCKELYMSPDQIKLMKSYGMDFGIHGYDHYWMNHLSKDQLAIDIQKAIDTFSGIVDRKSWICCYPYGSVSDSVIEYISQNGAVAGFTTVVGPALINDSNRFTLQRFDTNDFPPRSSNYQKYIGE